MINKRQVKSTIFLETKLSRTQPTSFFVRIVLKYSIPRILSENVNWEDDGDDENNGDHDDDTMLPIHILLFPQLLSCRV